MIEIPAGLHLLELTLDRAEGLWTSVKDYDRLFSDGTRGDKEGFIRNLFNQRTVVLETDDYQGLLFLSRIIEGLKGEVHAVMFDHKLTPRTALVRQALTWAFLEFDLHRLSTSIPAVARMLKTWMQTLGFKIEGFLRNDFWYRGALANSLIMGLLREEVLNAAR